MSGRAALLALLLLAAGCGEPGAAVEEPPRAEAVAEPAPPPPPARDTLLEAAFREAAAEIDGTVGVAALHLEAHVAAAHGGDVRFPLASVYKLPIAYAAVQGAGAAPDDTVALEPADRAPGTTPLDAEGGQRVPVSRLVELALAHSDNTASDALLRVAGGPEAVSRRMRAIGVEGVRVDRSLRRIFADYRGVEWPEGAEEWTIREFQARSAAVPGAGRDSARAAFLEDARDTGTAQEVVALLAALHRGDGLDPAGRTLLLEAMGGTATGPDRIRAGVPPGTGVAHKTGTLEPLSHDVGIVTLPDGGTLLLAVLVRSGAPAAERERVIAALARAAWARFAETQ